MGYRNIVVDDDSLFALAKFRTTKSKSAIGAIFEMMNFLGAYGGRVAAENKVVVVTGLPPLDVNADEFEVPDDYAELEELYQAKRKLYASVGWRVASVPGLDSRHALASVCVAADQDEVDGLNLVVTHDDRLMCCVSGQTELCLVDGSWGQTHLRLRQFEAKYAISPDLWPHYLALRGVPHLGIPAFSSKERALEILIRKPDDFLSLRPVCDSAMSMSAASRHCARHLGKVAVMQNPKLADRLEVGGWA